MSLWQVLVFANSDIYLFTFAKWH